MKFKMAAAAILNLLFLSILVKWSISGGSWHHCKISFIYVNRQLSYWCLCKNPRWRLPPSWIIIFVMLDHPQSPFVHLKFPFKFGVDRVRTFRDIVIHKFGLKCLFRPPKSCFWGVLTSKHYFFYHRDPKWPYLTRKHALSQACASTALC